MASHFGQAWLAVVSTEAVHSTSALLSVRGGQLVVLGASSNLNVLLHGRAEQCSVPIAIGSQWPAVSALASIGQQCGHQPDTASSVYGDMAVRASILMHCNGVQVANVGLSLVTCGPPFTLLLRKSDHASQKLADSVEL
jgi:hypothetical protein